MAQILINNRYQYDPENQLGFGGFSRTYLAIDTQNGHKKCVLKEMSFRKIVDDWKQYELFEREAKVLGNLDHPNIPKYIDHFRVEKKYDTYFYLVQEFIEGKTLEQWIDEGRNFTEPEVIAIARELAKILNYLHTFDPPVIHRDIKPGNIILTADNTPYLIDFGSVRDTLRTVGSTVTGTFGYMPWEQIKGQAKASTFDFGEAPDEEYEKELMEVYNQTLV